MKIKILILISFLPVYLFSQENNFVNKSSGIIITNTSIHKSLDFSQKDYEKLFFNEVSFDSTVNLLNTSFDKDVIITHGIFNSDVSFDSATFNNKVILRDVEIHNPIDFDDAAFSQYASFSDLEITDSGQMSFNRTILPDTLIFDYNATIPKIDFTEALFQHRTIYISLFKTDISKLHLDYNHFKLIWVNYSNFPLTAEDKETVYEELLNNFKVSGQTESYKNLDIEYNDFKWDQRHLKLFGWISRMWWNYGYNKELVFIWTGVFLLIFTAITFFKINYLNQKVYNINQIPVLPNFVSHSKYYDMSKKGESVETRYDKINNFFIVPITFGNIGNRVWYSFVYTASIFFRLTLKIEGINLSKRKGALYLIFMYVIGLVCLAYIANYIIQK